MHCIRPAKSQDLARIAEIEIFNYRLNFYPIFQNDAFYFDELQVPRQMQLLQGRSLYVYDDGVVKGFMELNGQEICKLFVEPVLQGQGIGETLLHHAVQLGGCMLWALEKNTRAIAFYQRHGFAITGERKPEDDTDEWLVQLKRT